MLYITSLYRHATTVQRVCAQVPGASANLRLQDFTLQVTCGGEVSNWRPRFLARVNDRVMYVDRPHVSSTGFVGWLPYGLRQWSASTDKMVFKQFAADHDVRTPAACVNPASIGGPFLVKKSRSSFGEGIRGPFLSFDASNPQHRLAPGEFYENFVLGHIVKAWYWGTAMVAVEFRQPPYVTGTGTGTGTGTASVRELLSALPGAGERSHDWDALDHLARYCGVPGLDAPVPAGKQVLVDLKYASTYDPPTAENLNVLEKIRGGPLWDQFAHAGRILACCVQPAHPADPALFALDAIVDAAGLVWFLEMNSNPMVHPDAYLAMVRTFANLHQQSPREAPLAQIDA